MGRLLTLTLFTACAGLHGQSTQPAYQQIRYEEDWGFLRDTARRSDAFDALKYVDFGRAGWYLTLGGEARERFELVDHPAFGAALTDTNGYLLQRYLLSGDFHLGARVRVFTELQSGLESYRAGGARPTDQDTLDIHQAFVDLKLGKVKPTSWVLRLGREEISFGLGRLISAPDGLNARRALDGARLIHTAAGYTWNVTALRVAQNRAGFFDDAPDPHQTIWGVGVYGANPLFRRLNVSLYYVGANKPQASFLHGTGQAVRHTMGMRNWYNGRNWDVNYEGFLQWGNFRNYSIRGWALATDTGYSFPRWRWTPRLGLRGGVTSGDRRGAVLHSFDPLFPSPSAYSDPSGLLAPINLADVAPSLRLSPNERVSFSVGGGTFFRESTDDGVYSFSGPLRRSGQSGARYVASAASASLTWRLQRHWTYLAVYEHYFLGNYLKQTLPDRPVNVAVSSISLRF